MPNVINPAELHRRGYAWPKYAVIERRLKSVAEPVDLPALKQSLLDDLDFCNRQLNDAFTFKQQAGADYADFTNRYAEHAETVRQLKQAICYLEEIAGDLERGPNTHHQDEAG